ncbi:hypothetical protein [Enterovibrio calviensis]|uniref:hypothetical protein n=1 Tax=Enterovibrio calviensis TaxID=91359 RepID=UPI003736A2FA
MGLDENNIPTFSFTASQPDEDLGDIDLNDSSFANISNDGGDNSNEGGGGSGDESAEDLSVTGTLSFGIGAVAGVVEENFNSVRYDFRRTFTNSDMKKLGWAKSTGFVAAAIGSGYSIKSVITSWRPDMPSTKKFDIVTDLALDLTMTAIAFTGPWGLVASGIYFGVDYYFDQNLVSPARQWDFSKLRSSTLRERNE